MKKKQSTSSLHYFCCTNTIHQYSLPFWRNSHQLLQNIFLFIAPAVTLLLLLPTRAWALQSHSSPEGLYVHQMAHILFMAALIYLFWDIRRSSFHGLGWIYLQLFCLLMFLWNFIAFTGHLAQISMPSSSIHSSSSYFHTEIVGPITSIKLIFFLTKLDHLVSVPAVFFLYLSLRAFYRATIDDAEGRS